MPKRKSKKASAGLTPPKAAALGILISMIVIAAFSAIGGALILQGILPEGSEWIVATAAALLAAFLGGFPLMRATGKKPLPMALTHAGLLLALLVVCKLIAWPGAAFGNWPVAIAAVVGSVLAGMLMVKKPKRRR